MIPENICLRKPMFPTTTSSRMYNSGISVTKNNVNCSEQMGGSLIMIGANSELRVLVKVYRTSLEHFAIVYPDKLLAACSPIGYVNLRNCTIELSADSRRPIFHVMRKSCDDGSVLTFCAQSSNDVRRWMDALSASGRLVSTSTGTTSSNKTRTSFKRKLDECQLNISLPILIEEGDEE